MLNDWFFEMNTLNRGLELLRQGTGNPVAEFREGQWEAISSLVERPSRNLVIQRTGWGKSSVYFIATKLLREQGMGPALLVSPLLSLMRNQLDAAGKMGVRAATINSGNKKDWQQVKEDIRSDQVDILLISPERLANKDFGVEVLSHILGRVSMLVVDEAHCISDWGHDFRPYYRLIVGMVERLPKNTRLLATTATANKRVREDLNEILGRDLSVTHGDLHRPNLVVQSAWVESIPERMLLVKQLIEMLPGSGIVYTSTVRDANRLALWLASCGIEAKAYTGSTENRPELEEALQKNELKVLVATVALGMGFDKPDLAFVIHFQMPGSPIACYQQIGRAGRGIEQARVFTFGGSSDLEIQEFFIRNAFPTRAECKEVLDALDEADDDGLSVNQILAKVNAGKSRLEHTLKLLSLENPTPLEKEGSRYYRTVNDIPDEFWNRVERLTQTREEELEAMQKYLTLPFGHHLRFLLDQLDAKLPEGHRPLAGPLELSVDEDEVYAVLEWTRRKSVLIEPRKQWPQGAALPLSGLKGRIRGEYRCEPGKSLCIYGDLGWGKRVHEGKYVTKRFDDELVAALVQLIRKKQLSPAPTWVTCIPSLRRPRLVPDMAQRVASSLGLPFLPVVVATKQRPEQKTMENSYFQGVNVDGVFDIRGQVPSGSVLLLDDIVDSRWTLTMAAWLLRSAGAGSVVPFTLATSSVQ